MKHGTRLALAAAVSFTLAACAPGARLGGGKEGAAEALFQASSPATAARGAALRALKSGASKVDIKVSGQKSGTATLEWDTLGTLFVGIPDGAAVFKVRYDNFSDDGKVFYNGSISLAVSFDFNETDDSASGNINIRFKGKLDMSGEISDFLDADVTQTLAFSAVAKSGASVSVVLDGHIQTASEKHTYSKETVSFTADYSLAKVEDDKA